MSKNMTILEFLNLSEKDSKLYLKSVKKKDCNDLYQQCLTGKSIISKLQLKKDDCVEIVEYAYGTLPYTLVHNIYFEVMITLSDGFRLCVRVQFESSRRGNISLKKIVKDPNYSSVGVSLCDESVLKSKFHINGGISLGLSIYSEMITIGKETNDFDTWVNNFIINKNSRLQNMYKYFETLDNGEYLSKFKLNPNGLASYHHFKFFIEIAELFPSKTLEEQLELSYLLQIKRETVLKGDEFLFGEEIKDVTFSKIDPEKVIEQTRDFHSIEMLLDGLKTLKL